MNKKTYETLWTKPAELPYVLYGDTSQATRDAMTLLAKHKIPYQLSLYHTSISTPALDTSVGLLRGMRSIRRFVGE